MPELPDLNYERVVIHDNFNALFRFSKERKVERTAYSALMAFNGRFIVFMFRDVALISTGMGSAQTNCLVESLSMKGCQVILKVGTCSALHEDLHEADVIIPFAALSDEGSTSWVKTKRLHDAGCFNTQMAVDDYITRKEIVRANTKLRSDLVKEAESLNSLRMDLKNPAVWSVDSYDCFDGSPGLYSKVNRQTYSLREFDVDNEDYDKRKTLVLRWSDEVSAAILGVEMECSALFSRSRSLECRIPAAALIVVSRTRKRLLRKNVCEKMWPSYGIAGDIPTKNTEAIEATEIRRIETAIEVARNWQARRLG